jgi:hypothetical protein
MLTAHAHPSPPPPPLYVCSALLSELNVTLADLAGTPEAHYTLLTHIVVTRPYLSYQLAGNHPLLLEFVAFLNILVKIFTTTTLTQCTYQPCILLTPFLQLVRG